MQCRQHKISYRNIKPVIASDLADNTEPAWLLDTDHTVDGLAVCYYNVLAHCFDPPQILFPNIKLVIFSPLKLLTTLPYPDAPVLYFKFLDFYLTRSTSGYYNIPPPSHSHSILTISYCLLHSCLSSAFPSALHWMVLILLSWLSKLLHQIIHHDGLGYNC